MRELGSTEDLDLGEFLDAYKGIQATIQHLGVGKARAWNMQLQNAQQRNLERLYLERKRVEDLGLKEQFPALWETEEDEDGTKIPTATTQEGEEAADQVTRSILQDCLTALGGRNGQEAVEEAFRLGVAHQLVGPALAMQNPLAVEVFSSGS